MATANDPQLKQSGRNDAAHREHRRDLAADGLVRSTLRLDPSTRTGNPFETIWQMSREIDRLMGSAFTGLAGHSHGTFVPQIDVEYRHDAIVVSADLPGIDKEDLRLEVGDETLTIRGERHMENEVNQAAEVYRSYERVHGHFYRTIALPSHAKSAKCGRGCTTAY